MAAPLNLGARMLHFLCQDLGVDLTGSHLVVAYSAGLDSTVLLHLLTHLAPRLGAHVIAAHAHHGLRPEAEAEAQAAMALCRQLGIPCQVGHLALQGDMTTPGVEDQARHARYAWLERVRQDTNSDWIVTAHHADDLTEDILLRLVRGAGWPALGGMPARDDRRHLLRPLLPFSKATLHYYAHHYGLPWCEDPSNAMMSTRRNRLRHQVLPLLAAENPRLEERCLDLWRLARLDAAFWEKHLRPWQLTRFFPNAELRHMDPALRLRVFKAALESLGPGQVRAPAILRLHELWQAQCFPRCIQFPGNKFALLRHDGVLLGRTYRLTPLEVASLEGRD